MKNRTILIADIVDNVRRIFHVLNEKSKHIEKETGLSSSQLWAIKVMAETAPMRVSDLANRMYLHPATVVSILDRLEARGLARRVGCERDHRVVLVELTEEGRNLVEDAPETIRGHLVSGLEKLSPADLREISRGLGRLIMVLGALKTSSRSGFTTKVNISGNMEMGDRK